MLSSIQQGIQSGHAAVELFKKYLIDEGWKDGYAELVNDWAQNHKTMVCLNGGNAKGIREWLEFFNVGELDHFNDFPFVGFYEDEESLDGALTSVAVVLPERIFNGATALREHKWNDNYVIVWDHALEELRITFDAMTEPMTLSYNKWERELMQRMNKTPLAR